MTTGDAFGEVENAGNGKPLDLVTPSPRVSADASDQRAIQTTAEPFDGSWSWWQIVLGKRDAAGGSRGRGWRTAPFVFLGEFGERSASFAFQVNIAIFFYKNFNFSLPNSFTAATNFFGAASLFSVLGAFVADAYLGRFLTFAIGCIFYLAGLALFAVIAINKHLHPQVCTPVQSFLGACEQATTLQLYVLYISLALQCLGSAGVKPNSSTFGADQFDTTNKKHESQLRHFFNWYYMTVALAIFTAVVLIIYIQDHISFGIAAIVCAIILFFGIIFFLCGAPYYVYLPPAGSPLTKMARVLFAAVTKRQYTLPENPDNLYGAPNRLDKESLRAHREVLPHTNSFRFLDKAAILEEPDAFRRYHPWRLATVQQVEELKTIIRIMPVWLTTVPVTLVIIQTGTIFPNQALTMNTHLGIIHIPPATMLVFSIATVIILVPIYDLFIIKSIGILTGNPRGLTTLQRIGIGTFVNILVVVCAALVEKKRQHVSKALTLFESPPGPPVLVPYWALPPGAVVLPISAIWLIPQYALAGITEMFVIIGQLEFLYNEAPESMRSISNALFWVSFGIGSFLSSVIVTLIHSITRKDCQSFVSPLSPPGSKPPCGWIQSNTGLGHLDKVFWTLAVVAFINFLLFLLASHFYVYKETVPDDSPLEHDTEKKSLETGW